MNKINPIFEALSGVDERHIPIKKTKRPIKRVIIAAAAAAAIVVSVSVIAGFRKPPERGDCQYTIVQEGVPDHTFELDLHSCNFTVPEGEEYVPQKTENGSSVRFYNKEMDMTSRELFEKFGITPLINDNFTDIDGEKPLLDFHYSILDLPEYELYSENISAKFDYVLYNKNIEKNVRFTAKYESYSGGHGYFGSTDLLRGEPSELITLKDGSRCLVTKSQAVFSHDGALFEFEIDYDYEIPVGIETFPLDEQYRVVEEMIEAMPGIDVVKQVLTDLGVL